jgi:hypothetical protein
MRLALCGVRSYDPFVLICLQELPQAELKTPGTAAYETIMTPLIEVCAGAEPKGLNYIVYTLINDDRYK